MNRTARLVSLGAILSMSATPAWAAFSYTAPTCSSRSAGAWWCGYRESVEALKDACPADRWIGYQLNSSVTACPAASPSTLGQWTASPMFGAAPSIPAVFSRFCVYQWTPAHGTQHAPAVSALPNLRAMRLERDCRVVSPQYVPTLPAADILQSAYAEQITLPLFTEDALVPPQVRVAVVDSAPDEALSGMPSGAADGHAMSVASLIREMSCVHRDDGQISGCTAFITTYRGLTLGVVGGEGTYGYPSEVGRAMIRAIVAFKQQVTQSRLIINISLGWDGRYGALHGPDLRLTALVPWLAAQWAAEQGATVIAAAGNGGIDPAATGPLYPGGWEAETLLYYPITESYSPVVYAIGAVDGADRALPIARSAGNPRLVAPASWVAAPRRAPLSGAITASAEVLTGTSMASAAASGIAALAWSHKPLLSSHSLMNALFLSATVLPDEAPDFAHPDDTMGERRRINACAFAYALGLNELMPCPSHPASEDATPAAQAYFDVQYPGLTTSYTPGWGVVAGPLVSGGADATVEPWVTPQPGGMSCPTCKLGPTGLAGRWEVDDGVVPIAIYLWPHPCAFAMCGWDDYVKLQIGDLAESFHIEIPGYPETVLTNAKLQFVFSSGGKEASTYSAVPIAD